jgi:hypothetical protein
MMSAMASRSSHPRVVGIVKGRVAFGANSAPWWLLSLSLFFGTDSNVGAAIPDGTLQVTGADELYSNDESPNRFTSRAKPVGVGGA